jgi:hypothetical protein
MAKRSKIADDEPVDAVMSSADSYCDSRDMLTPSLACVGRPAPYFKGTALMPDGLQFVSLTKQQPCLLFLDHLKQFLCKITLRRECGWFSSVILWISLLFVQRKLLLSGTISLLSSVSLHLLK